MSYSSNQYNYATPLSSVTQLAQEAVLGRQMFDFDAWVQKLASTGVNRGTYSVNAAKKSITITSTGNDAFTPYIAADTITIPAKPNTKYTLTCKTSNSAAYSRVFLFENGSTSNMAEYTGYNTSISISLTTSASATFLTFRVGLMYAGYTNTFSQIMINEGDAVAWERYTGGVPYPQDRNYFTLYDNTLDGSYFPIEGDVGLWGNVLSDDTGTLANPMTAIFEVSSTVGAIRIQGSQDNFPVNFTIVFYDTHEDVVHVANVIDNTEARYVVSLPSLLRVMRYVVIVRKISKPNAVVQLFTVYEEPWIASNDTLRVKQNAHASIYTDVTVRSVHSSDTFKCLMSESTTRVTNTIASNDRLPIVGTDEQELTNVHSKMKDPARQIFGKVAITYTDPLLDSATTFETSSDAYNSNRDQVLDGETATGGPYFRLYNNDLSGDYLVMDNQSQVGWVSGEISDKDGYFDYYKPGNQLLDSPYTESNKFTLTAQRADHYTITDYRFYAEAGKVYTASFKTDGVSPRDVEVFFLLNKGTASYVRIVNSAGTTFTVPTSGWYYLRFDVNIAGTTFSMWNVMVSEGTYALPYESYSETHVDSPYIKVLFSARPILSLAISFDDSQGNIPRDFYVDMEDDSGTNHQYVFTNNQLSQVTINAQLADIVSVKVLVARVAKPHSPAIILDVPISSTILYKGYEDESDLMSIDLLEELTYEDEIEAMGGVSANEVTVVLDNSSRDFFFNSDSLVSKQLRRNRKIVPYLGVEVTPGTIEWYELGTFWSYSWKVPVDGLTTTVVGLDTINLLNNTPFLDHQTQVDTSIGDLIEYVLDDAKQYLSSLMYDIDSSLYDIVIPFAWFSNDSHAAALRKISECYPMHIYCDRKGTICAKPQKLHLDYYYDVWSNDTNVIDKTYNSLYTTLPNIVDVNMINPITVEDETLAKDDTTFDVETIPTRTLTFNYPYLSDISVTVTKDSSVSYTYSVYSWGIVFNFTGSGEVSHIECTGTCVDTSNTSVLTRRDDTSVMLNGASQRTVSSDFIQTQDLAVDILDRLFSLSENDKYDATVNYRGDIALSINDPILLQDGIAPINKYNIKRHQLSWSGFLTASADLNT